MATDLPLRYLLSLGLAELWRRHALLVLTNQRVILCAGIVKRVERSLPLGRVQDVTVRRVVGLAGSVEVSTAGGALGVVKAGSYRSASARAFANELVAQLHKVALASP